ncbi:hypothetical protein J2Z60_001785 [Lactobacillus colini]|uniref:Phage protein n=1 Tax=Lactobacillus colini TaxID=1819254 RepID=A0ABS4MFX8_9LACO|nr:hypothetical protein [Lactobacillus colini]MBP2058597.1 hypothetical protein [Lactobacillus colini]
MTKLTEARKRANAKWKQANKDKQKIYQYRSSAKKYIKEYADRDELIELKNIIDDKLNNL